MSSNIKYRAIFISDIHLGSSGSKAKELLLFLKGNLSEYIYIVGDFL
jgi:UDP-2,3-diacylglucosamine pyrophosphatase LpxH